MKIIQLMCIIGIMLLSGCDTLKKETAPSSIPSTMYSNVKGKYYITALGTTDKQNLEFQQVIDQNVKITAGYYQTNTPSNTEMKMYEIKKLPKYIVFDTEKEIYETDNLNELNLLLTTLQK